MRKENLLGVITFLVLNLLLVSFSFIFPKNKNKLLFGSGSGKSFKGNPKYLYLYIIKNKEKFEKLKIAWITENKEVYKKLKNKNMPVVLKYSFRGFFKILQSSFIVIETSSKDFWYFSTLIGRFNVVQTWHGTPLKKISNDMVKDKKGLGNQFKYKIRAFFDVFKINIVSSKKYVFIPSPSKEVNLKLKNAFQNPNVKITGYPRNDVFFDDSFSCEDLKNELNLSDYSKIISYIPTFRDTETSNKPFTKKGLIKLNEYMKKNNYLLVIKKHPFDKNFPQTKDYSNIKDHSNKIEDVQELLIYTDLLITDYSSVFFDFCLTDKPIIFYPYDYEEYLKKCRGMYYDYYKELVGPFTHNEEELLSLIKDCTKWFKKKSYKDKYKKFKDKFNKYQDGKSCERVIKEILKLK